ncbi:Putative O-acetyltransferase [Erwinia amylovora Ea644]|uniref:acyltransferase family protein n=1 Tax=Erwinia amylovora TaxID=552 RepID=UPI0002CB582C|nr:acyltransferase family protein [Erwinia amylovora]CCP02091.1 Putative O-acetyltransferase [Erwinia amylovora Ea644]CCP06120.1 Putative O-acetyltransferase [Erwinia amylovora MR1]
MKYRADIDGLRALAVLPVIAYHMGIGGIPGGFTGVDIFFVISGYLICGIIYQSALSGQFSYLDFYKRRCLRILPPLFVVLLVTLLFGYYHLLPTQFNDLSNSATATLFSASNIFFWKTTGYFDGPAELKPLLHTWSLAVEEQFYIIFPIVLLFVMRIFRRRTTQIMLLIIVASLALSIYGVTRKPTFTFYMLPTRAWELALGGIIAVAGLEAKVARFSQSFRHGMSLAGLALILYGFLMLNTDMPFPAWNALWPCVGSFLIILAGQQSVISRLLALKPVVYIGMISYCLYLWHWPIIVYARMFFNFAPGVREAVIVALTLGLAVASRYLIEIPFRYKLSYVTAARTVTASVIGLVVMAGGTLYKGHFDNHSGHFSPQALALAHYAEYNKMPEFNYQYRRGQCFVDGKNEEDKPFDRAFCLQTTAAEKNYVMIGDSHAAHLWRAISLAAGDRVNVIQATSAGCKPLSQQALRNPCSKLVDYVYDEWLPQHKVDGIIISARWAPEDIAPLRATLDHLRSRSDNIMVMGPTVEYTEALPNLLAYQTDGRKDLVASSIKPEIRDTDRKMAEAMSRQGIRYISVWSIVCPGNFCRGLASDGRPFSNDYGHFTLSGAKDVAQQALAQMHNKKFM